MFCLSFVVRNDSLLHGCLSFGVCVVLNSVPSVLRVTAHEAYLIRGTTIFMLK